MNKTDETIIIYTDGSCVTSKKKHLVQSGGWCHYIIFNKPNQQNILVSGSQQNTTNNRMEMIAVLESFGWIMKDILKGTKIIIYSDSTYVVKGATEWMYNWQKNDFKVSKDNQTDRLNADLWRQMYQVLIRKNNIKFVWVKAHDISEYNNLVDRIAREEAEKL